MVDGMASLWRASSIGIANRLRNLFNEMKTENYCKFDFNRLWSPQEPDHWYASLFKRIEHERTDESEETETSLRWEEEGDVSEANVGIWSEAN